MKSTSIHPQSPASITLMATAIQRALPVLYEAHVYAQESQEERWEFAIELQTFLEVGSTRSALRWLISEGYVEHAIEKTRPKSASRQFRQTGNFSFPAGTCFLLTRSGIAMARENSGAVTQPLVNGLSAIQTERDSNLLPRWNAELRELRLGSLLIKVFRRSAPNQETVLAAFEEEGWPPRIYNPLPAPLGQEAHQRIHDAVARLNRHRNRGLIHFRYDNNGEGVRWELVQETPHYRL